MVLETATYLLFLVVFSAAAYACGWGALELGGVRIRGLWQRVYAAFALGLTLLVLVYSGLCTRGITVNLIFVPLLLAAWILAREARPGPRAPRVGVDAARECALELGLVLLALFALHAYVVCSAKSSFFLMPRDPDRGNLSDFATFLSRTGKETNAIDYIFTSDLGVSPYHYFELWLTGGLAALTGKLALIIDQLVTAPLIGVVVFTGMRAVGEALRAPRWMAALLAFSFAVFNCEARLPFLDEGTLLGRAAHYFNLSALEYPKFFTIYLYSIAALLLMLARRYVLASIVFLAAPVANILVAPAAFPVLLGAPLVAAWRKRLPRREAVRIVAATAATALLIFVFYRLFHDKVVLHRAAGLGEILEVYAHGNGPLTAVHIVGGTLIQVVYVFSPFLALGWAFRKRLKSFLGARPEAAASLVILAAMCAAGLAAWTALYFRLESHQLCVRILHVALNLAALVVVLACVEPRLRSAKLLLGLFFAFKAGAYLVHLGEQRAEAQALYSPVFLEQVARAVRGVNPVGAFVKDASDYDSTRSKRPTVRPGEFTGLIDSRLYPMGLSAFDAPVSKDPMARAIDEESLQTSVFYKFVTQEKEQGRFVSIAQSQLDYLDRFNVQYLILSKRARVPAVLAGRVRQLIEDPASGEKVAILTGKGGL